MNRYAVVCSLLVGALAGCDTLFPGPGGGQSGSLTGIGPDGGVCEKDPQTIKNVMLAPPACNATNPCPCGTFCSSQTGGNCVADCVDDSWCAPGHFCSGYGQCLAGSADGGTGDGPGPNTDPACPRNEPLLDSIRVMRRSCEFDDGCPFGSFCDHVQESCDWECRSDAQCASMNTDGHTFVCGCLGKCVEVSAPRVPATQVLPKIELSPSQYGFVRPSPITGPDWGADNQRTISAVVVAPFLLGTAGSQTGPAVKVQANPGPGLLVACPGSTNPPSASPCTFDFPVAATNYKKVGDVYRSQPVNFTVQASTDASFLTATSWTLRFESKDLSNVPQAVPLRYLDQTTIPGAASAPVPVAGPDSNFIGTGRVEMFTPTGVPVRINVKAREFGGNLVLFDESQQLSPSGKLVVIPMSAGQGMQYAQTFVSTREGSDPSLQATFRGRSAQMVTQYSMFKDPASQRLSGTFDRVVVTESPFTLPDPSGAFSHPREVRFLLNTAPATAVGACTNDGDCSTGSCDLGFCSALPPHRFYGQIFSFTEADYFTHERMSKWGSHWPVSDSAPTEHPMGFWGLYVPSSYYLAQVAASRDGYSLHGPVARISGEPLADLFNHYGYPLVQNQRQVAFPLLTQHDQDSASTAPYLLKRCLAELSRDRQTAQPTPSSQQADYDVFDVYTNCINLGRATWALADHTTHQRALQAWLQVHSFVMREGLEEVQATAANGGIPGNADPNTSPPTLEQILGAGESGLGFLIDATRYSSYYPINDRETIWSEVDYRQGKLSQFCNPTSNAANKDQDCNVGDGPITLSCDPSTYTCQLMDLNTLPQHEQPVGVPPYILEATASYLKVLDAYIQKIARQTYGQPAEANPANGRRAALARFGTGMRLAWFAEELAVAINAKAPCIEGNPNCGVIKRRFEAARDEMNALRARVASGADALQYGRNPLNIPEDDVPLFFGDPTGKSSRYFAASDYLLDGWAAPAVSQAAGALDAARAAWIQRMQSGVQDELNKHNRQQEIDQLNSKYGAPILANCGSIQVPDDGGNIRTLDSNEIIPYFSDPSKSFSNATCFVDAQCIGFGGLDSREELRSSLRSFFVDAQGNMLPGDEPQLPADRTTGLGGIATAAQLFGRSEVCKMTSLTHMNGYHDTFIDDLRAICPMSAYDPVFSTANHDCEAELRDDGNIYLSKDFPIPMAAFYGPIKRTDIGPSGFYKYATDGLTMNGVTIGGLTADPNDLYGFHDYRTDNRMIDPHYWSATFSQNFNGLGTQFCGSGKQNFLKHDYPRPDRTILPPSCYKGALGVAFYQGQEQNNRLTRAKQVLDNGQKQLDDQRKLCDKIEADLHNLQDHFTAYMEMLHDYNLVSGLVGSIKGGFEGLSSGGPIGAIAGLFSSGLLATMSSAVQDEAAQLQYLQATFSGEEKAQECWNTFRAQRNALATAMTDIQIAANELNAQLVRYQQLQTDNLLNLQEGKAAYQRELDSPVGSVSHHFWVDERIQTYKETFEWSRRLTFIAMRAVEYEFQQSLPYRSAIISAETAAELQKVIIGLKQEQASRTINRRRPDEASVVLSLRDDVLAVADNSEAPAGERNWTAAQKFASRLYDSRYAYRDAEGNYLGQAVPFDLKPTGILEARCGERLWRATATIQGDGVKDSAPGASILLLKRNSFQSQYCSGKARPTADGSLPQMQIGVTHTSADLFQPGSAIDLSDANQFTASLLFPWFNVPRSQFYNTAYQQGSSEELAGRGLYGDYVLLFPQQVLEDGFALDKVEDVLLRLDYLSVDNLSQ